MESKDKVLKKGKDMTESIMPPSENVDTSTEKNKIKAGNNAYINLDYDDINFNNKI